MNQEAAAGTAPEPTGEHLTAGKKRLISAFLAIWLVLLLVDALPATSSFHQRLKDWVDPFLDMTGLWQGSWQLYAPEVDKIDIRLSAEITYTDGSVQKWASPDWRDMSIWQKFVKFRSMEYFDNVRQDDNAGGWDGLADYLARTLPRPAGSSAKPKKVTLVRHWSFVPPLKQGLSRPFRERREFKQQYVFLVLEYP